MKKLGFCFFLVLAFQSYAQEVVGPMLTNPSLYNEGIRAQRSGGTLDSTFIYSVTNLDLQHVWDDFSKNKFVKYPQPFNGTNVTSQWYSCLMNTLNTIPEPSTAFYCDTNKARLDTVKVTNGIGVTTKTFFPPVSIWINDLNTYPISGSVQSVYSECYVITDSIIFNVSDTTYKRDTTYYTSDPTYPQDSIHLFFANLNDTNDLWLDNSACRNMTMAVDPWSLGVATFDAVDSTGWPYSFGSQNAHGPADVLTSKPINLFGHANVYLQFIYQPQGFGNMPEDEDSLIVDLWLADSSKWYPWWQTTPPYIANQWDTAFIPIPGAFLDDGFQFRFRNYATLAGALDHWHIDYVQLYENPLGTVQYFKDLAVSYPVNTLLKDYTSVPWDHYLNLTTPNDQMLDTAYVKVYNSDVDPTNVGANMYLEVQYNGAVQGNYVLGNPGGPAPWTSNWVLGMNGYPAVISNNHLFFDAPGNDSLATFDFTIKTDAAVAGSNVFTVNDTVFGKQVFKNYYAYDDGSAEVAYGIQGTNSQLAYEFNAYEADTLTGVLMHFVPSVTDVSGYVMLLTVWEDDGTGMPGNILYQDDYFQPHYPEYGGSKNEFKYYEFLNPQYPSTIPVPQNFFVGWEQIESQSLNIGMDRNQINNSKIKYNVGGSWITSSQPGSLMMRPVFSTGINHTLRVEQNEIEESIKMYPNPSSDRVIFQGLPDVFILNIYDLSGRLVYSDQNNPVIDIEFLQNGVYVVDVRTATGVLIYSDKLIKQ